MATVKPFLGLRFSSTAGPVASLVAPPYDVLSQQERDQYAARSPHNIVHLTLPEKNEGDRSQFVRYARSASRLENWRAEGVLRREDKPAFYRYRQTFAVPGNDDRLERLALIACIRVEPYANGVVLPHEQTFPKHKEDRLRLLEATRAHLECIFGLYEDDDIAVLDLVKNAPATQVADVTTDDDVRHILEAIDGEAVNGSIARALSSKKVWIADGHHRYETALAFRQALGAREGEVAEDYMMMALSSISDPGLVLMPTHRILNQLSLSTEELRSRVSTHFQVSEHPNDRLGAELAKVAERSERAFGIALPEGKGLIARFDPIELSSKFESSAGDRLKRLDVTILHDFVFAKLLGLTGHDFFAYTRDDSEAIKAVESGAPASFLMNPPTVEDMRLIALGGEKMPQKSTFYYPKILSGLVLWSLSDFQV